MANIPVTPKQKLFYESYYTKGSESFGNGIQSASKAGYKGNDNTLGQAAHQLLKNSKAKTEKARIQTETGADVAYTVKQYQQDLIDDRTLARTLKQPSAAVSATVAMGRSMGYDKDNDAGGKDKAHALTDEDMARLKAMSKVLTDQDLAQGPRLAQDGQGQEQA